MARPRRKPEPPLGNSCGPQLLPGEQPSHKWDLDQLSAHAQQLYRQIIAGETTLAPCYWRLGQALKLARKHFGHGHWCQYLKSLGIDKTRSAKACAIFRHFKTADELAGMSVEEAYAARLTKSVNEDKTKKAGALANSVQLSKSLNQVEDKVEHVVAESAQMTIAEARDMLSKVLHAIERLQVLKQQLRRRLDDEHFETPAA